MTETLTQILATIVGYVWGLPLVIVLTSSGLILTVALGLPQIRGFWHSIQVIWGKYDDPNDPGDITHFQALCTALSATVGLGNISGVAVAIHYGGPGAIFWMVVIGFLGMSLKFTECTLSLMYREIDSNGEVRGGPMYYITKGLGKKWKPLAIFFAIACTFAAFGAGNMFQANQVASAFSSSEAFNIPVHFTGLILSIFTGIVIIGGIKRIASVTSKLVPLMGFLYIAGGLLVIFLRIDQLPSILGEILSGAFTGHAAGGGAAGIAVRTVLVQGVQRACFSNEAGLGSSPIAHSAAATKEPVREGVVALLEPFIDTILVCSTTALVILFSGVPYRELNGVELTSAAFNAILPGFGTYFIPIAILLFAYSTLLSWSYYGQQTFTFLFGSKGIVGYKLFFCFCTFIGSIWTLGPVLNFSDIMLGLMVVPNLIAILLLLPKVRAASKDYFERMKST